MRSPAPATRAARTVTANRASTPGATSATPDANTAPHTIDNRPAHRARTTNRASQPTAPSPAARTTAAHKPLRTAPQRRPI